jgi:hypothetical protein
VIISYSVVQVLTLLVLYAASGADTARQAAQQLGAAANALHIEAAARAKRAPNTASCAIGQTGNLRRSESGKQSYGGESESVHGSCETDLCDSKGTNR